MGKRKNLRTGMAVVFSFILAMSLAAPIGISRVSYAEGPDAIESWDELQKTMDDSKGETELKLAEDIKPEEGMDALTVSNGQKIILDLAGHTIDRGLGGSAPVENGYVIFVREGGVLTLTDSTKSPGKITGGANTGNGGGVFCEDGAALTVTGGVVISGNTAKNGAGIYLGADCELYLGGCNIRENDVRSLGGGIYGGSSHISFLGGVTKVKNNYKNGDENDLNDLYMPAEMDKLRFWTMQGKSAKTMKQVYSDELKKGSSIGILLESMDKIISDGYGQCNSVEASAYFSCENSGYEVSESRDASEVTIVKTEAAKNNASQTVLEIYKGGKLKSSKQYDSFISAFKAGADGSGDEKVVVMGADYSSDAEIVLEKDKTVIVDLNGHYIKRDRKGDTKRNGGVMAVMGGATLTIRDSNPKRKGYEGVKGGVITGGASSNYGGGITVREEGHLIMEGGTIYDCITDEDGGGVYVESGSKNTSFVMTGGCIDSCKTIDSTDECCGGAIYLGNGKLDLSGGKIRNCYSEDDGGAIYCMRGEVSLENMLFNSNKSNDHGGAIYIELDTMGVTSKAEGTHFAARGCKFIENEAQKDGGAFYMRDNPDHSGGVLFDQCEFKNNKSDGNGGAIVTLDDGMVLSNVDITGNTARGYGGGVFVDSRYTINVKGVVVIRDNESKKDDACRDMCLEDGTSATALVNSGGLSNGSWIGIGSTSKKSIQLAKNISVFEMKYFHSHVGKIAAKNVKTVEAKMVVTASLFGVGNKLIIIIIAGVALVGMLIMIIMKKKESMRGAKSDSIGGGL